MHNRVFFILHRFVIQCNALQVLFRWSGLSQLFPTFCALQASMGAGGPAAFLPGLPCSPALTPHVITAAGRSHPPGRTDGGLVPRASSQPAMTQWLGTSGLSLTLSIKNKKKKEIRKALRYSIKTENCKEQWQTFSSACTNRSKMGFWATTEAPRCYHNKHK